MALRKYAPKIALAWNGGKDATVLLHMIREIGNGKVTIPVMFFDTGLHFDETSGFVNMLQKAWDLPLVRVSDKHSLREYRATRSRLKKRQLVRLMKARALKKAIKEYKWKAVVVGIRWDEHEARRSEVYFSPRKHHVRIHPLLHFSEQDVWDYTHTFKVPYNPLYDLGYRTIGEKDFTKPLGEEREGKRSPEKRSGKVMAKLRTLGYF